jgi:hypothetical protein
MAKDSCDGELFQPSECYFACGIEPDGGEEVVVSITGKEYWEEEGCLDDCFGDHCFDDDALPSGVYNLSEATWESNKSIEETRTAMEAKGFVWSQDMHDFMFVRGGF